MHNIINLHYKSLYRHDNPERCFGYVYKKTGDNAPVSEVPSRFELLCSVLQTDA